MNVTMAKFFQFSVTLVLEYEEEFSLLFMLSLFNLVHKSTNQLTLISTYVALSSVHIYYKELSDHIALWLSKRK